MRSYFCDCFEDQKCGHRGSFNVYIKQNQKGQPMGRKEIFSLSSPHVSFALWYCKLHRMVFKCAVSKAKRLHSTCAKRQLARGTKKKYCPGAFSAKLPIAPTTSPVSPITVLALWTKKGQPEDHFSSNRANALFHL